MTITKNCWEQFGNEGSKDLNKNDENNNFVKNYKNLWDAMASGMRGSKIPNENDKSDNFAENDKNTLRAMAWGMRGSKDPNKNDENDECNDLHENYKKVADECNDMKDDEQQFEWDH